MREEESTRARGERERGMRETEACRGICMMGIHACCQDIRQDIQHACMMGIHGCCQDIGCCQHIRHMSSVMSHKQATEALKALNAIEMH
jgi:hypothetical protein